MVIYNFGWGVLSNAVDGACSVSNHSLEVSVYCMYVIYNFGWGVLSNAVDRACSVSNHSLEVSVYCIYETIRTV